MCFFVKENDFQTDLMTHEAMSTSRVANAELFDVPGRVTLKVIHSVLILAGNFVSKGLASLSCKNQESPHIPKHVFHSSRPGIQVCISALDQSGNCC